MNAAQASLRADRGAAQPHALRDYSMIADGERGGLIGPRGDLSWLCFPAWHSDALFSSLIGGRGVYALTPEERFVWGGYYEPRSLMWRNRWVTARGVVECRDALAVPATPRRAVLLRSPRSLRGRQRVDILLQPRHRFGRDAPRDLQHDGERSWRFRTGAVHVRWTVPARAQVHRSRDGSLHASLPLDEHAEQHLVLELSLEPFDTAAPDAAMLWRETAAWWQARVPELSDSAAPRDAAHAVAVLTGMTASSGGTVAAATTSLPERADTGRSYDYRYVWCRDQSYIGQAAAAAGIDSLLDGSTSFIAERLLEDGERMAPAYTAAGERIPDERSLRLPGYPGGADIAGNHVTRQFQLDGFGEALLLFAAADATGRLDARGWDAATRAAASISQRWQEQDSGVWELEPRAWTHSRLVCAAGLRALARRQPGQRDSAEWSALADRIVADTAAHALHPSGRWQRAPDDERVDASLLLAAIRGAVPADDPRSVATADSVEAELHDDGYLYRYRADERPLGDAEGAFLLCGFWMALARHQQGADQAAMRWFDRNRSACGPPGLFSEEFDVRQRQLRGNLPQAFVHALLLECAIRLGQ